MPRLIAVTLGLCAFTAMAAESPGGRLWMELKAKRDALSGAHQEFDVSRTFRLVGKSQASQSQLAIDRVPGRWREASLSGSGNYVRIFDGTDVLQLEEGGDEFVRVKRGSRKAEAEPEPYGSVDAEWAKATELGRPSCGLSGKSDLCALIEAPIKPWTRNNARMLKGVAQFLVHLDTGLLLSVQVLENVEGRSSSYQIDTRYNAKQIKYGVSLPDSLFRLPTAGAREVKELSPWNAARIRKQLAGQPAPELEATDLNKRPVKLSALKGKVVLLDFWTTWCPPCRADAPALDKLYRKYGGKDLEIIGISVSEERGVVEGFLRQHPHDFPVVLTSENPMPRPYQVGVLPTYMVINPEGEMMSAVEGDQGFSDLRKLLKKAGLEVE